ncbi:MAG: peptide deformylase [Candidatus Eisenbacteria bacterium]|nr:peptide deformylase [Candidatus Eisenbacteria bacterium]
MASKERVCKYGSPVLRRRADEIEEIDESVRKLAGDMFATLERSRGVGLAAPQIGVSRRIIVLSIPQEDGSRWKAAIINPEIVRRAGTAKSEEGCLSVPGVWEEISRSETVEVRGLDLDGKEISVKGEGILARALQHELDHLDGILIVDRIGPLKRHVLKRHLRKLEESTAREEGSAPPATGASEK